MHIYIYAHTYMCRDTYIHREGQRDPTVKIAKGFITGAHHVHCRTEADAKPSAWSAGIGTKKLESKRGYVDI